MKYIDLAGRIISDESIRGAADIRRGIRVALEWLDHHPDQVPGRTITESELRRIAEDSAGPGASTVMPYIKATVEALSITIVPDPTNAEQLEALLEGGDINAQWGLRGGGVMFARELAHALDEAGVKAPGGDS